MKKKILFALFSIVLSYPLLAASHYVAPDGSDVTGIGTIDEPYATIMRAYSHVSAGDSILLREGSYTMSESQISGYQVGNLYACMNVLSKSGTAAKRIFIGAYRGERPIIDMRNVKPAGKRVAVFYVNGSYHHIKGLEIIKTQVTITTHTQSECFRNEGGSNNIYEQCVMRDGMAIGFYLTKGANNLVLNCDAYNNWDNLSEDGKGGNTDGFGFHGNKGSTGNVCRGCRAWYNSDDGYDCISNNEPVTFDNCWAFYNGYSTTMTSLANGTGFKVGGYGQAPAVSSLPNPLPRNVVRSCIAYYNKANGFYANHHVEAGHYWYNNTACDNSPNYNMLSQKIAVSSKTGRDTTLDCEGISHVLHNNLSYKISKGTAVSNLGTSTATYNTFTPAAEVALSAASFLSADARQLTRPRKADGSLPHIDFLRPKEGSTVIDQGKDVGLPYSGAAPDLGAFEFVPVTGAELKEDSVKLSVGASYALQASTLPYDASSKGMEWLSRDANIATVDTSGVAHAVSGGQAYIVATSLYGGFRDSCLLLVNQQVVGVEFANSRLNLKVGESARLVANVLPTNAFNKKLEWISNNPAIALVDTVGKLVAIAKGKTTIVVVTEDGGYEDRCQVTVEEASTGVGKLANSELTLYPNPVKDLLHIKSTHDVAMVRIFTPEGTLMYSAASVQPINFSTLAAGTYFVHVWLSNGRFVVRSVVKG